MPPSLRCLLHRTVDQQPDSRHAAGQTGRRGLCATGRRVALQALRPAATPGRLRQLETGRSDVRRFPLAGDVVAGSARRPDTTTLMRRITSDASRVGRRSCMPHPKTPPAPGVDRDSAVGRRTFLRPPVPPRGVSASRHQGRAWRMDSLSKVTNKSSPARPGRRAALSERDVSGAERLQPCYQPLLGSIVTREAENAVMAVTPGWGMAPRTALTSIPAADPASGKCQLLQGDGHEHRVSYWINPSRKAFSTA